MIEQPVRPWSIFRTILVVLAMILLISACEGDKPIKIGFIAGTSGRVADLGIGGLDAVQMIVDDYNAKGGINGRKIQLIVKNDQQNPDIARQAVEELINEKVVAIVGPMTSDMGMTVAPILDKAKLLNVAPTVTTERLSGIDDHFFRATSTVKENASISANYQIDSGDMKAVAAVYDAGNISFTENWLDMFSQVFTARGGRVVRKVSFNTREDKSFSDVLDKLRVPGIDGILVISNSMDAALFCQQIRKVDKHIKISLADWAATEQLLVLGGKAVEGATFVQTFNRDHPNPSYQSFRKRYLERYNKEPGFPGVHAYDAANVVLTALKEQKSGQGLKETVLAIRRFKGLQSDLVFDDYGDVNRKSAAMGIIRNLKFVVLE